MKRWIDLTIALSITLLSLTACGEKDDTSDTINTVGEECEEAGDIICSSTKERVLLCGFDKKWTTSKECSTALGYYCVEDENGAHCDNENMDETVDEDVETQDFASDDDEIEDESIDETVDDLSDEDGGIQDFAPVDEDIETQDSASDEDETADDLSDEDVGAQDFAPVDENLDETVDDDYIVTYPSDDPHELITDRHFSRGFRAINAAGVDTNYMNPGFSAGDTVWHLGQWGSYSDLSDAPLERLPSNAVKWADLNGSAIVGIPDSAEADLSLFVDGMHQYGGIYYDHSDTTDERTTWVHLLVEQLISAPGAAGTGTPPLSELSALNFSVDAKLLFDYRNIQVGHDTNQHAAQYLIYFTIQNLNSASDGYGDFLWFGLRPYDDREAYPGLTVSGDDFSGKLIYNIGIQPLSPVGLGDNQWHALQEDLLPHIKLAIKEAWSRNYMPKSRVLSDYRIGAINIGWECSGLNNTEMQIKDLSLTYAEKPIPTIAYGFNVDGNKEGWTTSGVTDLAAGGPKDGYWIVRVDTTDPYFLSPQLSINAASYSTLSIVIANDGHLEAVSNLQVYWKRFGDSVFTEAKSYRTPINNGGGYLTFNIDLSGIPTWKGEITQIRIDPVDSGDGTHAVGIDSITLTP